MYRRWIEQVAILQEEGEPRWRAAFLALSAFRPRLFWEVGHIQAGVFDLWRVGLVTVIRDRTLPAREQWSIHWNSWE